MLLLISHTFSGKLLYHLIRNTSIFRPDCFMPISFMLIVTLGEIKITRHRADLSRIFVRSNHTLGFHFLAYKSILFFLDLCETQSLPPIFLLASFYICYNMTSFFSNIAKLLGMQITFYQCVLICLSSLSDITDYFSSFFFFSFHSHNTTACSPLLSGTAESFLSFDSNV